MNQFIEGLKNRNIHTPVIVLVRLLLALGLLLTLLSNDMNVVANHGYGKTPDYNIIHSAASTAPFKKIDLFLIMAPAAARIVVIIILLLVMSGMIPQLTGILHFWACFSVHNYFMILNGGDQLSMVLALLLIPICLTDPRFNQWKRAAHSPSQRNIVAGIALFAIKLQASYVYLDACISKLSIKEWKEGTAVYYFTSHSRLGAPSWLQHINEIFTLTPFVRVITWSVLALEFLLFLCIFLPAHIRRRFFIPAIIFHFLIVINFGLISFFLCMAAMLIMYLYDEKYPLVSLLKPKSDQRV